MRLLLISFALVAAAAVAFSASSSITVDNPMGYANNISRGFAAGDNKDASGWRECVEAENFEHELGIVCEGVRSIQVHGGKMVDVNYFCEFRFVQEDTLRYQLDHQLCQ